MEYTSQPTCLSFFFPHTAHPNFPPWSSIANMPLVQIFIRSGRCSIFLTTGWASFLCCSRLILILNPFPHTSQIHPSAGILSESLCAIGHVRRYCQCFTFVFPHLAQEHKFTLPMLTLEMFSQSQDPSCLLPTTWT